MIAATTSPPSFAVLAAEEPSARGALLAVGAVALAAAWIGGMVVWGSRIAREEERAPTAKWRGRR